MAGKIGKVRALDIAVLIPCFNEARTIGKVVTDIRDALPGASVYVYDNNSRDDTADIARAHGALVRDEPLQGKSNTVRRMFADIEADIYVSMAMTPTRPRARRAWSANSSNRTWT